MEPKSIFTYDDLLSVVQLSRGLGFTSDQPIEKHIQHSLKFISLIPDEFYADKNVLDLGAGGGLPSLVWLFENPEIRITAVDANRKRTRFLNGVLSRYSFLESRFHVVNARAEILANDPKYRERFPLVVARGFAPPAITAECATGFIPIGGHLAVSGRPDDEESRWDKSAMKQLGLEHQGMYHCDGAHVIIFNKVQSTPGEYPRRFPAIKRNPLFKFD